MKIAAIDAMKVKSINTAFRSCRGNSMKSLRKAKYLGKMNEVDGNLKIGLCKGNCCVRTEMNGPAFFFSLLVAGNQA